MSSELHAIQKPRWFYSTIQTRGTALVLHGINMLPSRMDAIAGWLSANGIDAYRAILSGHDGDMEAFKTARRKDYIRDTLAAWQIVATRAAVANLPVHVVGFSFGALMAFDLLHSHPETHIERAVLFAPAVAPRLMTRVALALRPFPRFVPPSWSRPDFRMHPGAPIAAYTALFASVRALHEARYCRANIPTLVFIDPQDALVSLRQVRRLTEAYALDAWHVIPVTTNRGRLPGTYHHLITEPDTLGEAQWQDVVAAMKAHLGL